VYSVLIVAYRRHAGVAQILHACENQGVDKVFVHVDAPRNEEAKLDVRRVISVVEEFANSSQLDISMSGESENRGSAVSLIRTCDLIFGTEENLIILEDDCIPGDTFFEFAKDSFEYMKSNENVALFCGTQFAPVNLTRETWLLSPYPFQWGWGTNRESWRKIRGGLISGAKLSRKDSETPLSFWERSYWNAGCRRALQGFTDVWDTLYVRELLRHGLTALLPGNNLVQNIGNDQYALHTDSKGRWNNLPAYGYVPTNSLPVFNQDVAEWSRANYFRISLRHSVTTQITKFRDYVNRNPSRTSLVQRLN